MNQKIAVVTDNRTAGHGVRFERIRRITGYLVGDVSHFNDAKRAEVNDRVKHMRANCATQAELKEGGSVDG